MAEILTRRDFLSYSGATLAGVTLGEWGRRRLARADAQAQTWRGREQERFASSVCRECAAGCGLRARLVDDVPVKVDGNPNCPISRGRLCPKGQASIEAYYDPDRLLGPARRVGTRGNPRWEPISWAAATTVLASELERARGNGLAIATEERGAIADEWTHFWTAAGMRVAWALAPTAERLRPRLETLTGASANPVFDLEHASYVLSFGAPLVEDWLSPVWAQRSYGQFRRGRAHGRGRLVQVDYRRSLTAKKADEWLAVSSETQMLLAYGIMSVLLGEDRVDRMFLDQFGGNLAAFDREIVARYGPDTVSAATGVPVVSILRLARELTATPQPLVVVAADADPNLIDAVLGLNALIGAFERPGGIFAGPAPTADSLEDAGPIWREVCAGRLRPHLVALRDASLLRALNTPLPLGGVDAATFVVSFSPYLDETSALADLLMPAPTPLESWHALALPTALTGEMVALARPAVRARLDTRDVLTTLKAVGDAAGGELAAICESSEEVVRAEAARVHHLGRGAPFNSTYETEWLAELEKGGWWVSAAGSAPEFVNLALAAGGWSDPVSEPGRIRGALAQRGGLSFAMPLVVPPARLAGPVIPVINDSAREQSFPARLFAFTPATVALIGSGNAPALFELLGQPESAPWHAWAEISADIAAHYRVRHGSRVRISSSSGSIEAIAMVIAGMPACTIALAFVPSTTQGGRWARAVNADARALWGSNEMTNGCPVHLAPA